MSSTRERFLTVATGLFAQVGYEGASVRSICSGAEANLNAVSYHFGGKRGLYNAVIRGIGEQRLASAARVLGTPAANAIELETRLLMFAEETLAAWLDEPELLIILFRELQAGFRNCDPEVVSGLADQSRVLLSFLQQAATAGLLRDDIDLDILAGALLERLNNQVVHADAVHARYGRSILDDTYRAHWLKQTIQLMLHGAATQPAGDQRSGHGTQSV